MVCAEGMIFGEEDDSGGKPFRRGRGIDERTIAEIGRAHV